MVSGPDGSIYVGDHIDNRIRKIDAAGVMSTFAGDGTAGHANGSGAPARFDRPEQALVDSAGTDNVAGSSSWRITTTWSGASPRPAMGVPSPGSWLYLDGWSRCGSHLLQSERIGR